MKKYLCVKLLWCRLLVPIPLLASQMTCTIWKIWRNTTFWSSFLCDIYFIISTWIRLLRRSPKIKEIFTIRIVFNGTALQIFIHYFFMRLITLVENTKLEHVFQNWYTPADRSIETSWIGLAFATVKTIKTMCVLGNQKKKRFQANNCFVRRSWVLIDNTITDIRLRSYFNFNWTTIGCR